MGRIAGNQTDTPRDGVDWYPTDPRWTQALIDNVKLPGSVWEPAAGDGAMARVLEHAGYAVRATDLIAGHDFLTSQDRADTIVTNPPFRHLHGFVQQGLRQANCMLCLLVGWHLVAGGRRRYDALWGVRPPTEVIVVVERMPVLGKSSQFNHAWLVWDLRRAGSSTEPKRHSVGTSLASHVDSVIGL